MKLDWYIIIIEKTDGTVLSPIRACDFNSGWELCARHLSLPCLWYEVKQITCTNESTGFTQVFTPRYLDWYLRDGRAQ